MGFFALLLLALSVSLDALAVSVAGALCDRQRPGLHALAAGGVFGGFQFLMPLAGFYLIRPWQAWVTAWDHWLALILLTLVGGKMLWEAARPRPDSEPCVRSRPFAPGVLLLAGVATSLDALAVGISLALLKIPVWPAAVAMGLVTALVAAAGVLLAVRVGRDRLPERAMTAVGGAVIILIGIKIFFTS